MTHEPLHALDELLALVARLCEHADGCPAAQPQNVASMAPPTIENGFDRSDARHRPDWRSLRDELGELMLQVIYQAPRVSEGGVFDFTDVARSIGDNVRGRAPHVAGSARCASTPAQSGETLNVTKRVSRGETPDQSALSGVSRGLPECKRAEGLQQCAAAVGFAWGSPGPVLDKLAEELTELRLEFAARDAAAAARPAIADGTAVVDGEPIDHAARLQDELGDVLFVMVNLARHAGVDFTRALRHANHKFERRFRRMEALAAQDGHAFAHCELAVQERLWQRVKREESMT